MNELMVVFGNAGYVYFETEKEIASSAYYDFIRHMRMSGINVDNLHPTKVVLRDINMDDIGEVVTDDL